MPTGQNPSHCDHQIAFAPALDHAAVCRLCGAIVRIAPRKGGAPQPAIEWVIPAAAIPPEDPPSLAAD